MVTKERMLVWILRLGGVLTLSAFFAMFLPVSWMAASHRWLGLGSFPETAIVDYLTRSISGMYAMHGVVLLVLSTDIRRYLPLVRILGFATVAFGIGLLLIDLHAGMPIWWTLGEGPFVTVAGILILVLVSGMDSWTQPPPGRADL